MDEKEQQAERELLELIAHCRATIGAYDKLMRSLDPTEVGASGFGDLCAGLEAVFGLEEMAQKGLEKLRKPKGEP